MFSFPYTCINLGIIIETYNEGIDYKVLKQAQFKWVHQAENLNLKLQYRHSE